MPRNASVAGVMSALGRSGDMYNYATGGTVTTFTNAGKNYRRHLFTTAGAGSLVVMSASLPFRVTIIGGGGNGGLADPPTAFGGGGGGGGGWFNATQTLTVGTYTLQVGDAGTAAASSDSVMTGIATAGGGGNGIRSFNGTGRTDGRAGTGGGNANGANGMSTETNGAEPAASLRTLLDGTVGTWGKGGAAMPGFASGFNPGTDGMVCVEYEIA